MEDGMKDARDGALLLVGFAGGLRRSEIIGLNAADIETVRQGLIIHLRRSKTDQEGAGRKIGIPFGCTRFCPVMALQQWRERSGVTEGPILRPVDRHGRSLPLSSRASGPTATTSPGSVQHSFWANDAKEEKLIWNNFLSVISKIMNPHLIHYGSYETSFLKRMCQRYGGPPEGSHAATAVDRATNLLSFIHAKLYFPTYSNGLKEIAGYLGFRWSGALTSGLDFAALPARRDPCRPEYVVADLGRHLGPRAAADHRIGIGPGGEPSW
jgi:hypothetical protein